MKKENEIPKAASKPKAAAKPKTAAKSKSAAKFKKKQSSGNHQSFGKVFWKTIGKMALLIIPIVILVAAGILWKILGSAEPIDVQNLRMDLNSTIYYLDESGNMLEYEAIQAKQNRDWAEYSEIPQYMKDAFVSIEDERFFSHTGFDIKRTTKAVLDYMKKGSGAQGGSTITQQLVKNITGNDDLSPKRKIQEIWLAYQLEQDLSKEQILELYMNTIYLANGVNGVQTAARKYFDKDVSELSLAECASIAGITQYPSKYDPLSNHGKENKIKQETILRKMLELGKITQEEHDLAVVEVLNFKDEDTKKGGSYQSYIAEIIINDAIKLLMREEGITEAVAKKMVYSGGYQIISSVDPKVQQAIDDVYKNYDVFRESEKEVMPQSAIVVMDPQTGFVKGLSGGIGERAGSYTLNRAVDTTRQPGSCMKPLAVYAPALEQGLITPKSLYTDKAVTLGPTNWSPKNYYSGFKGQMTVQRAVDLSVNTIPAQIIDQLGPENAHQFVKDRFHISTLTKDDKGHSLALGGLTNGVTVMDMTAAYAVFANNGYYTEPTTVLEIRDSQGRTVVKVTPQQTKVLNEQAATSMHQMLLSVVNNPGGTGSNARRSDVKVGGKTGSTDNDIDRWFVGYTPNYVAAVWYGYDTPKPTSYNYNPALLAWDAVMDEIMKDAPARSYATHTPNTIPSSGFSVRVCSITGLDAAQHCVEQGSAVSQSFTERAPKGTCTPQAHVESLFGIEPPAEGDESGETSQTPGETSPSTDASTATPSPAPTQTPSSQSTPSPQPFTPQPAA